MALGVPTTYKSSTSQTAAPVHWVVAHANVTLAGTSCHKLVDDVVASRAPSDWAASAAGPGEQPEAAASHLGGAGWSDPRSTRRARTSKQCSRSTPRPAAGRTS
jgi:hypothetical protein